MFIYVLQAVSYNMLHLAQGQGWVVRKRVKSFKILIAGLLRSSNTG